MSGPGVSVLTSKGPTVDVSISLKSLVSLMDVT